MSRNLYTLSDDEIVGLYNRSLRHCAQTVLDNIDGGDDSQDYIESAIDILHRLNTAYRDTDTGDVPYITLRDEFNRMFHASADDYDNHPYLAFASDAVPSEWDEFIENEV